MSQIILSTGWCTWEAQTHSKNGKEEKRWQFSGHFGRESRPLASRIQAQRGRSIGSPGPETCNLSLSHCSSGPPGAPCPLPTLGGRYSWGGGQRLLQQPLRGQSPTHSRVNISGAPGKGCLVVGVGREATEPRSRGKAAIPAWVLRRCLRAERRGANSLALTSPETLTRLRPRPLQQEKGSHQRPEGESRRRGGSKPSGGQPGLARDAWPRTPGLGRPRPARPWPPPRSLRLRRWGSGQWVLEALGPGRPSAWHTS